MNQRKLAIIIMLSFLLGCHRGYIALWKEGHPEPVEVFPYKVTSLPPADQQALTEGIEIHDEQQLHSILEDFLS